MSAQSSIPSWAGDASLALLAVLIIILSLAGAWKLLLPERSQPEQLVEVEKEKADEAQLLASKLQALSAVPEPEEPFVLAAPEPELQPESVEPAEPDENYLLFTGTALLPDQSRRAIVNGSVVAEGSSYRGCAIKKITESRIFIEQNGTVYTVPLYEKFSIHASAVQELILDRIIEREGRWEAVFGGQAYRAGDWLDSTTVVRAITPTQVLIERDGQRQTLLLRPK